LRINQVGSTARAAFYDRNPLKVNGKDDFVTRAPAGGTQRWIYTVPAARKTQVDSAICLSNRATVGAPGGEVQCIVMIDALNTSYVVFADSNSNTVGFLDKAMIGTGVLLLAADAIRGQTSDSSTGGTVTYLSSFHGVEFDA
jgi:hypothetical protein